MRVEVLKRSMRILAKLQHERWGRGGRGGGSSVVTHTDTKNHHFFFTSPCSLFLSILTVALH